MELQQALPGPDTDMILSRPPDFPEALVDDNMMLETLRQEIVKDPLFVQANVLAELPQDELRVQPCNVESEQRGDAGSRCLGSGWSPGRLGDAAAVCCDRAECFHVLTVAFGGEAAGEDYDRLLWGASCCSRGSVLCCRKPFGAILIHCPMLVSTCETVRAGRERTNLSFFEVCCERAGNGWDPSGASTPEKLNKTDAPCTLPGKVLALSESHLKALFMALDFSKAREPEGNMARHELVVL